MGDLSREPSMEEILSSIRRVIARDEAQIAGANNAPPPGPAAAGSRDESAEEEDVLDLTAASAMPSVAAFEAGAPTATAASAETAPAHPEIPLMPAAPAPLATPVHAQSESAATDADAAPLVSPEPQAATRHTLDVLAAAVAQGRAQDVRPVDGDTTVNALVESALRPMLRDWLDANLPAMVERIVEREIVRITGSRA